MAPVITTWFVGSCMSNCGMNSVTGLKGSLSNSGNLWISEEDLSSGVGGLCGVMGSLSGTDAGGPGCRAENEIIYCAADMSGNHSRIIHARTKFHGYLSTSSWAICVWTEVVDRPSEPWKRVAGWFYLIASGYRQWENKHCNRAFSINRKVQKKMILIDLFSSPSSGLSWSLLWKWVCLYRSCTEVLERYWRSLGFLEAVWSSGWSWTNAFLHSHRYESAVSSPELQIQSKFELSYLKCVCYLGEQAL